MWATRRSRRARLRRSSIGRQRAPRHSKKAIAGRAVRASDSEPQPRAQHGQNERAIALGRKSWLFAGSLRGAERAAVMYTLIQTAKLNDIDPQAWLADVLARIADMPQTRLAELLPGNWCAAAPTQKAA